MMLPVLETILSEFGRRTPVAFSPVNAGVDPAEA
jgi:hypothetical protein